MRGTALLAFLTLQRGVELALATRNTKALRAKGAYERGAEHYPVMVALHATYLGTLWLAGRDRPVARGPLAAFVVLQAARVWVLRTLGARWTTRIVILPGAEPIATGPYRFVRHPNYVVVALELPCVSAALGRYRHAALFGALNVAMLAYRIRAEDAAFAELMRTQPPT